MTDPPRVEGDVTFFELLVPGVVPLEPEKEPFDPPDAPPPPPGACAKTGTVKRRELQNSDAIMILFVEIIVPRVSR